MKIIFSNLPMKKELLAFNYKADGNVTIEYDGEVIFPVNAVLAKTIKQGEKVKVVLLSKMDIEGNSAINAGIFQKELNGINRGIGQISNILRLQRRLKKRGTFTKCYCAIWSVKLKTGLKL